MGDELNKLWQKKEPTPGGAGAAVLEPPTPEEAVAAESSRQLEDKGWCLWRCSELGGDVIVVIISQLITDYPQGYPVYTLQELKNMLATEPQFLQVAHQAKKEMGAKIEAPGGGS